MVAEITIECARYLRSRLVRNEALGRLELHGVGGPDEYHPITNNNAYTNHLTADILRRGADWARTHPAITSGLQVSGDEIADWERAAAEIFLPFDPATGLIPQCDGFHDLAETWEQVGSQWGGIGAEFERCKGLKQPDVLLLLTLLPGQFPRHVWRTNWDYYERFILHGSSLSPSIHALVGARVGLPQRARHYFDIAANFEFRNHNKDTQHGIHIGNCGGVWQAVVLGFAGLGEADGGLSLDPALPAEWKSLQFTILWQGQRFSIKASNLRVVICAAETNSRAVVWRVFGQEHLISPSREETIERKS
jgi:trehalose/maltose hydrolase-like predicted phosphorylase